MTWEGFIFGDHGRMVIEYGGISRGHDFFELVRS
jgi:hypothetical protein